jgi:hypothetical protein
MMQKPVRDLRQLVPLPREHHREPHCDQSTNQHLFGPGQTTTGIALYVIDRDRISFVRRVSDSIGPRME